MTASSRPEWETEGERLLIEYLNHVQIRHERWPLQEGRQPDRLVHTAVGDVVFEVKDIEAGVMEQDLFARTMAAGGVLADVGQPPTEKSIQRIIEALAKLPAVQLKIPFVPAIYNNSFLPHTNRPIIMQALYGPTRLSVPVGPGGATGPERHEPSEDMLNESDARQGFFGRTYTRRVSAVAVLCWDEVNKEKWGEHVHQHIDRSLGFVGYEKAFAELQPRLRPAFEQENGPIDLTLPRMSLFHNPFAVPPLAIEAFASDAQCYQLWYDRTRREFLEQGGRNTGADN